MIWKETTRMIFLRIPLFSSEEKLYVYTHTHTHTLPHPFSPLLFGGAQSLATSSDSKHLLAYSNISDASKYLKNQSPTLPNLEVRPYETPYSSVEKNSMIIGNVTIYFGI